MGFPALHDAALVGDAVILKFHQHAIDAEVVFGIMYGFVCGCFLSLSPAVASQLYGSSRLAGLSGLLLMFNLPGMYWETSISISVRGSFMTDPWHRQQCRCAYWRRDPLGNGGQLACGLALLGQSANRWSHCVTIWYVYPIVNMLL